MEEIRQDKDEIQKKMEEQSLVLEEQEKRIKAFEQQEMNYEKQLMDKRRKEEKDREDLRKKWQLIELQMRKELEKNEGVIGNTKDKGKDQTGEESKATSEDKKRKETIRDRNNNTHKKEDIERTRNMETDTKEGELQLEEGSEQESQTNDIQGTEVYNAEESWKVVGSHKAAKRKVEEGQQGRKENQNHTYSNKGKSRKTVRQDSRGEGEGLPKRVRRVQDTAKKLWFFWR